MPNTQAHEVKPTKDAFIKTQDVAYLLKELVQEEIQYKIENEHTRPNVICDCITLDPFMRNLLAQGESTSIIAAYRGEPGYIGIAERADTRANDKNAAPADYQRFVETTALFKGHANFSQYLLSIVPDNMLTTVYDTNVEMGAKPVKIAIIDSASHTLKIDDLRVMSEFLNKKNINTSAIHQVDLILDKKHSSFNILATHPEMKASTLLNLVADMKFKPPYSIQLMDDKGKIYAEVMQVKDNI
jgi:hypothetical protein